MVGLKVLSKVWERREKEALIFFFSLLTLEVATLFILSFMGLANRDLDSVLPHGPLCLCNLCDLGRRRQVFE